MDIMSLTFFSQNDPKLTGFAIAREYQILTSPFFTGSTTAITGSFKQKNPFLQ